MRLKIFAKILICLLATIIAAGGGELYARQDMPFPSYGSGAVEVRMYSDYFCRPCQAMEPTVEPTLKELVKKNRIRLTLVDVPFHRLTSLYARYFLFALKEKNDVDYGFHIRNVLFTAAATKDVSTKENMEELFRANKIPYADFNAKPAFDRFNTLIKEDHIKSTPTCVIIKSGQKQAFVGGPDIINALKGLK